MSWAALGFEVLEAIRYENRTRIEPRRDRRLQEKVVIEIDGEEEDVPMSQFSN